MKTCELRINACWPHFPWMQQVQHGKSGDKRPFAIVWTRNEMSLPDRMDNRVIVVRGWGRGGAHRTLDSEVG